MDPLKIFVDELHPYLRRWVEVIRENAFCLPHNREHLPACCAHMLYCLATEQPFTFAYFVARRMANVKSRQDKALPYSMLLTRLHRFVMNSFPHLLNNDFPLVDPMMDRLSHNTFRS